MLPTDNRDLLEVTYVAHLPTVRPDGSPQNNPVWFAWDGTHITISQTKSRQKFRNLSHQRLYPHHQPGDERVIVYIRPTAGSAMAT